MMKNKKWKPINIHVIVAHEINTNVGRTLGVTIYIQPIWDASSLEFITFIATGIYIYICYIYMKINLYMLPIPYVIFFSYWNGLLSQ